MSEALLTVENLSKSYGEKVLFKNISFGLLKGQKTALIARNGTGKSSLLNILTNKILSDEGKVTFRNDIKIAYLSQNPEMDEHLTILDYIFSEGNTFVDTIKEYESALFALEQNHSSPETQQALHIATEKMDSLGAWDYEARVKEILSKLEIHNIGKTIHLLSGGERKKVALSKILIDQSDLLILDEPTNHLDISMIEWLEGFLSKQNLSILLVTHDRYFLDNVCTDILELADGNLYKYKGHYDYFLEKREDREFRQRQEADKARNLLQKEQEWMRRMPSARGTKAKARIDAFYDLQEKAKQKPTEEKKEILLKTERMGGKILEIYNVSKKFGNQQLINDFSYIFKKGEKIGIIGPNGVGKSTFLNILTETLRPDTGNIVVGQTVRFGYYTQEGLPMEKDLRVIEIIREEAEYIRLADGSEMSASQFLNYFGFPYPLQYTHFSGLSGGERRRLYLLKILIRNPNFLILDEPTNDLDLATVELLERFLMVYAGCLIIVSHDRSFMDNIVDHVFVFEGNGNIKDFPGNYTQYREKKQLEERQISQQKKELKPEYQKAKSTTNKPTFKQQKEYEALSNEIALLEKEKAELNEKLSLGNISHDELIRCSERIGEVLSLLEEKEMQWLELAEIIEG